MMLGRRAVRRSALLISLLFLGSSLTNCFSERVSPTDGPPADCEIPAGAQGAGKAVVTIKNYDFSPDTLKVAPGTIVTWVNCETGSARLDAHTTTSDTGLWNSPTFVGGQTFVRTFGAAGTFPYHCVPHTSMKGVILVQ